MLLVKWKKNFSHRLLFYLSASDVFAMTFKLVVTVDPTSPCPAGAYIYTFFLHMACVWTCVMGFHILWVASSKALTPQLECIYFGLSIFVPLPYLFWLFLENDMVAEIRGDALICSARVASPAVQIGWPVMRFGYFGFNVVCLGLIIFRIYQTRTWSIGMKKSKSVTLIFIQICFLVYTISSLITIGSNVSYLRVESSTALTESQGFLNSVVVGRKLVIKLLSKIKKLCKERWSKKQDISKVESGAEMLQDSAASRTELSTISCTEGHATLSVPN